MREVYDNTTWGLRAARHAFQHPFRGARKHYLHQYVAVFQWAHNKVGVAGMIRTLLGLTRSTPTAS